MTLRIDSDRSRIVVETAPRGVLARLAHELRIEAQDARVEAQGDGELRAAFPVRALRVVASRGRGAGWEPPTPADRAAIEQRIRDEVFSGVDRVMVSARLTGDRAALSVSTPLGKSQRECAVQVTRDGATLRVAGELRLSLAELRTGEPRVPFGAVRLDDAVLVRFDVALLDEGTNPAREG